MLKNKKNELLSIVWCDNGMVDGKFAEGLIFTFLNTIGKIPISSAYRFFGGHIASQREQALNQWIKDDNTEWLLWVDSDVVLTADSLQKIWDIADKNERPVVTGTVFSAQELEQTLMKTYPLLFVDLEDGKIEAIHPMPYDSIIKVDSAGMGFVLMHRSVILKMKKIFKDEPLFAEIGSDLAHQFVSEDIAFFRKLKKSGIQLYAHTGALAQHMKRFSVDVNYYGMYWNQNGK